MSEAPQPNPGRFISLGLEMAIGVGLGFAVGWWLDQKFGWSPWATIGGTALGLASGMYLLIRQAISMNKK